MRGANAELDPLKVAQIYALIGKPLGTSDWKVMKHEDIVRFADASGDHQWIHVDKARAERESPFKAPVAHGYFTLSLIGGLFFALAILRFRSVAAQANL